MINEYQILLGIDIGNTNTCASILVTEIKQEVYKAGERKGQPKGDKIVNVIDHKVRVPTGFSRQVPKGLFSDKEVYQRNGLYVGLGAVNGTFIRLMNAAKYDAEYLEPVFYAVFSKLINSYEVGVQIKAAMESGATVKVVTGMPENFYKDQSFRSQFRNALDLAMTRCEFGKLTFQIIGFRPEAADIYALYRERGEVTQIAYWLVMDVGFGTLDAYGYDPEGKEIEGRSISKLGLHSMAENYDVTSFDEVENNIHVGGREAVPAGLLDKIIVTAERLKTNIARQDFPVCLILASGGGVIARQTDKNRLGRMFPDGVVYGDTFDNADAYLNHAISKVGGV